MYTPKENELYRMVLEEDGFVVILETDSEAHLERMKRQLLIEGEEVTHGSVCREHREAQGCPCS